MGESRSINAEPNPGRKQSQARQPPSTALGMRLITLYVQKPALKALDEFVRRGFYPNRAEAIRFAIHDLIDLEISKDLKVEKVDVDVRESEVEIREKGQVYTVNIQRNKNGTIWGVYPNRRPSEGDSDIVFPDGMRNLLILFRKGVLKLEDFPRQKEAP